MPTLQVYSPYKIFIFEVRDGDFDLSIRSVAADFAQLLSRFSDDEVQFRFTDDYKQSAYVKEVMQKRKQERGAIASFFTRSEQDKRRGEGFFSIRMEDVSGIIPSPYLEWFAINHESKYYDRNSSADPDFDFYLIEIWQGEKRWIIPGPLTA